MAKNMTKTIDGIEYEFQMPPFLEVAKIEDRIKDKFGVTLQEKEYKEYMNHIIVVPSNLKYEDFKKDEETEKKIDVNGYNFKLVRPEPRELARMQDASKHEGKLSNEKLYEQLMKHVIAEPEVSYDYFDEIGDTTLFREVMNEASKFCYDCHFIKVMKEARNFFRGKED
ncbi:hypothetical protein [Desertibacillus haloalkaliphilus]|uniref:hypothetical protein n=1 Tax=Desertibacillus haloalkaliphilus TaxID=1328930 RepID=UPI001C266507|nr:hypothetical protein [Desertibacillus haloalkaliphilus]MBU8908503.1 hypothetical protein [Desertibacillus haloalkaliphilus]